MGKIIQLSESVIAKIAAGEVIERPAYVVKELLDNALDAGATTIEIKTENGGLDKIMVTDNGQGMSKEDLLMSFKRHTTSKLSSIEELSNIRTHGFRGEALASIAAVSNVTIRSRRDTRHRENDNSYGNDIAIHNGEIVSSKPVGMPVGTQVIVSNLFNTVPARKKFLQSAQKEYRQILQIVEQYALAHPSILFRFYHNNRTVYMLPPVENTFERIKSIFSRNNIPFYIPLEFTEDYHAISGYIAKPQLSFSSLKNQYWFVNSRHIHDTDLSKAMKNAYGTLLEPKSYPSFVIYINLPHQFVDVNVDPKKERVHFIDKGHIIENLQNAVKQTLAQHNLHFIDRRWNKSEKYQLSEISWQVREGDMNSYAARVLRDKISPPSQKKAINYSTVQQLHNLYIVVETKNGIALFDQHAAHERILYEKLRKEFKKELGKKDRYQLPKPISLDLRKQDDLILREYQRELEALGFSFSFSDKDVSVLTVPLLYKDKDVTGLMQEIIDSLLSQGTFNLDTFEEKTLTYLACRNAVKAGDKLSKKRCQELIKKLQNVDNNATCPHGRPTQIVLDVAQLNAIFKRN